MSIGLLPLELRGIAFRYGRQAVLRKVDLKIEAGEVVALLGANGAGKTTLFSVLCGLIQPDQGERRFAGALHDEVGEQVRAGLAHLGHRPQVYPLLSARENLELFASLRQAVGASVSQGERFLRELGLGEVLDRSVSTFSRGMGQRVALARALAQDPQFLILDEPFTALDPAGRGLLIELLRQQAKRGRAVLLASHDLESVAAVCDRALVLRDGVIAQQFALGPELTREQLREHLAASLSAPERRAVALGA